MIFKHHYHYSLNSSLQIQDQILSLWLHYGYLQDIKNKLNQNNRPKKHQFLLFKRKLYINKIAKIKVQIKKLRLLEAIN